MLNCWHIRQFLCCARSTARVVMASLHTSNSVRATGKMPINSNKDEVYYDKRGSGSHALLCIPGALGTADTDFSPQLDFFGSHDNYTVVGYDPLGYGASRPPRRNFQSQSELFFERDAADGHTLMKELSLPRFSVLGWSDGGIAAMFLAARFPAAVSKLVIWGANAYLTEEDKTIFSKIRDVSAWSPRMREAMEAVYGAEEFPRLWGDWVDGVIDVYHLNHGDICKAELNKIKCPTLIVHGVKDAMCPQFHAEYIHSNIAGSQLLIMPEGKHNLHLKYSKEFNNTVDKFLTENTEL